MSPKEISVAITPTRADVHRIARLATRRLSVVLLAAGSLLSAAGVLAIADGDPMPFLAGMLAGLLGVVLLAYAVLLPWQFAGRVPESVHDPRTCDITEDGIHLRAPTWAHHYAWADFRSARVTRHLVLLSREPGRPGLALPRSGFAPQQEIQLTAILGERGLLATNGWHKSGR